MEYLDIVNENGLPTGQTVERGEAHEKGILHRTSHVWLLRKKDDRIEVLLQKRCETKDSHPGCYDISSAGHIPAGVDFVPSAIRELKEELGVEARADELILCGDRLSDWKGSFYGKPFHNREFSRVFALWLDIEAEDLVLQEDEISEARWMDLDQALAAVIDNSIPHCIFPEELKMVRQTTFYLSDDHYAEDMRNIAEPYVNARAEENYFRASDGTMIHYAIFRQNMNCGSIVISHGFTETMEKYKELIYYFLRGGYDVFMLEHRGHGYSDRAVVELDKVHVESFDDYVNDFCLFMESIVLPQKGQKPLYLFAHSMGSGITAAVMEKHPEYFDKAVLSCPMLDPDAKLPRPLATLLADTACLLGASKKFVPFSNGWPARYDFENVSFSSPTRYQYYLEKCLQNDHLITYCGTYGWLKAVMHGTRELMKDKNLQNLTLPLLVFQVKGDQRVLPGAIDHLSVTAPECRLVRVEKARHELFDADSEVLYPYMNTIFDFLEK